MKITLIAVGTKMPTWITTGFEEYQRRFPKDMPFELIEIPAGKRGKNADIKRILEQEGKAMLAACGKGKVVTLDIPGKPWTTPQLAEQLEGWKMMVEMFACLLAGQKAYPLNAKQQQNKVGHFHHSHFPIR